MKKNARRDEFTARLFGLSDKSVEFRTGQRTLVFAGVWLALSLAAILVNVFFAQELWQAGVIAFMGFIKYVPLLGVVYGLAKRMAARYLDDIYELNDEDLAADFLEEVTFGYGHEHITIREGKIPEGDEQSPIILIGGPGEIQVNLDNVALLERVDGTPEVIYPRSKAWKLGRFERIREIGKHDEMGRREYAIINLRDQFVSGLSVKSRTKDGIPLELQGIKVIFSILRKPGDDRDHDENDAYIFDERAVQSLVYNQALITPEPTSSVGIPFPWDTTVVPLITSELEDLITSHTLSEILASISQKEVDQISTNEQTIAQMRVEMTGAQPIKNDEKKETRAPNFESRSKITSQFFNPQFKKKAAELGVAVEWIDIGTWQLPNNLILDKYKDAWNKARDNAKKRGDVERSRKKHEMDEFLQLIINVILFNYEKANKPHKMSDKERRELEQLVASNPNVVDPSYARQIFMEQTSSKKDAFVTAVEILRAFRMELLAARILIEKESTPAAEKQADLDRIDKALYDISHLTHHMVRSTPK